MSALLPMATVQQTLRDVGWGPNCDICSAAILVRLEPYLDQWSQAARTIRMSISLRSEPKSMGLVKSASAPFSNALRLVSASP